VRQELDVIAKAKASYSRLANLYQLLELNKSEEALLIELRDATQGKFEVSTQGQADLLLADNERQKILEVRRDRAKAGFGGVSAEARTRRLSA
jgi:hypothetical protein